MGDAAKFYLLSPEEQAVRFAALARAALLRFGLEADCGVQLLSYRENAVFRIDPAGCARSRSVPKVGRLKTPAISECWKAGKIVALGPACGALAR